MGFFEDELRKIMGTRHPDAAYVGRACYTRLDAQNRAKLEFVTLGAANRYAALRATILNRQGGKVDDIILRFSDLLGIQRLPDGYKISPHFRLRDESAEWYYYNPDERAYQALSDAVEAYLDVYRIAQTSRTG